MKTPEEKKEYMRLARIKYRENNKEKVRQSRLEWEKRNPDFGVKKRKANYQHMREKYPEKFKARYALKWAVRSGKMERLPCEVCKEPKTHGHHEDYSKPLEVVWLCTLHHNQKHGKKL